MVRFQWHVEDGFQATIPPGGIQPHRDAGDVWHLTMHTEVAGQKDPLESLITLPKGYMGDSEIRRTGIILAHGTQPDHKSKLLTELAVTLASKGFLVARYQCHSKELRRVRDLEKTLDAVATSPFARTVERWAMVGLESGGRVASAVLHRCRGEKAGLVCISFPLQEPSPTAFKRGSPPPTSEASLLPLTSPLLLVRGTDDSQCPLPALLDACSRMTSADVRVMEVEGVDGALRTPNARSVSAATVGKVVAGVVAYLVALDGDALQDCGIPTAASLGGVAAGSGSTAVTQSEDEVAPVDSAAGREDAAALAAMLVDDESGA